MNHRIASIVALGLTASCSSLGAFAQEDLGQEVADLRDEVSMLRAELAAVARDDDGNWLTEERADQIRALVSDVLADADTRASLLQRQGMTSAGWDKKFYLQSDDGNYRLNIGGQIQTRYAFNNRNDPGPGEDSSRGGFTVRRAKLAFSGHLIDPSWQFALTGAFERDQAFFSGTPITSGEMRLQDAYIVKELDEHLNIKVGQYKGPYMKEELLSSKRFQAADRSLVNERFNQDRTQGVLLNWEYDQWRLSASYNDGPRTANNAALLYDTEYSFGGRFEFLGGGTWKQFRSYQDFSGNEPGYLLGVAAQYWRAESGTPVPSPKEKVLDLTADVMVQFGNGLNLFTYLVYRNLDEASLEQWGAVFQAGYFIVPDEWDIFARYEYGDDDGVSPDDLSVLTVGFNRYFDKQNIKWTTDFGFGLNPVSSSWDSSGAQWLADGPGEDGQFVLRSQLQLLF